MISKNILDKAIEQVATNEIGVLKSVNVNKGTVVLNGQVYPNFDLLGNTVWQNYIGSNVLVCFKGQSRSNGVVVGVIL